MGTGKIAQSVGATEETSVSSRVFMDEALKPVNVKIAGEVVETTKLGVVHLALFQKAAAGDTKAMKMALVSSQRAYAVLSKLPQAPSEPHFSWTEEQEKLFQEMEEIVKMINQDDPKE